MPHERWPAEQISSEVLRQHRPSLEKTPEGEGKPMEAERPWMWWQDKAAMRSEDKHVYSFTQIISPSYHKHLFTSSTRSSVSYYLICLTKRSLSLISHSTTGCSVAWASCQGVWHTDIRLASAQVFIRSNLIEYQLFFLFSWNAFPHISNINVHISVQISRQYHFATRTWALLTFWAPSTPQAVNLIMIHFKQMISAMLDNFFLFVLHDPSNYTGYFGTLQNIDMCMDTSCRL